MKVIQDDLLHRPVCDNSTVAQLQSGPEKIAQSLMHCHFATVFSRLARFCFYQNAPKRSLSIPDNAKFVSVG